MIIVKVIIDFDDPLYNHFRDLSKKYTTERVAFELLDTNSKKDIKQCLSYFSNYGASEKFIIIEHDLDDVTDKFLSAIYKEEIKTFNDWEEILANKLAKSEKKYLTMIF